jgi:hypothetical protein
MTTTTSQEQQRDWLADVFFSPADAIDALLQPLDARAVVPLDVSAESKSPLRHVFQVRGLKPSHFDLLFDRMARCPSPAARTLMQRFVLLVSALTVMPVHNFALQRATEKGSVSVERFRSAMAATSEVFHDITCTENGQRRPIAAHFMRIFWAYLSADRAAREPVDCPPRSLTITPEDELSETERKRKQFAESASARRDLHLDSDSDTEEGIRKKRK